jgi:FkbM family methyltransferase
MLVSAANIIKRRAPALYKAAKWAYRRSNLPAVKLLDSKCFLVAPHLVHAAPTEPHVLRWIAELLQPGDIFCDVGAHYGWMSLVACRRVGTTGRVIAFEPSPPLAEILRYNQRINRLRQMEVVAGAVADADDQLLLFYLVNQGDSFMNSLVNHTDKTGSSLPAQKSTMEVHTITLNEFCKQRNVRPDLIKIDVEGGELLALYGARGLLSEGRCKFIVAVHPGWLPQGQSGSDVFGLFRDHGYRIVASQSVEYEGVYRHTNR